MANRDEFINSAVSEYGLTSKQIDSALKEAGFDKLNKFESTLVDEGKWGTNLGERTVQGLKDVTSGLSTLISYPFAHPRATVKAAGDYLKSHTLPQMLGDLYDTTMKPVQLDTESVGRNLAEGGVKGVVEGTLAGAYANPFDAALLTAPAWGKGLAKGVKAVANRADKLPLPKWTKGALRGAASNAGREVNSILRDSKQVSSIEIDNLKNANLNIKKAKSADIAQAVRNLERGIVEGTEEQINLTNQLKDMTNKIDEMMAKAGYNPEFSKAETINQYVTRYFQDQGKHIPISKVEKLLGDDKLMAKYKVTPEEVQMALKDGERLYAEGLIKPIKHKTTANTIREGYVEEAEKKLRDKNAKMYGTQTYDDVAEGIKSGAYDNIIKTLDRSESSLNAVDEMIKAVGKTFQGLDTLASDEVVVSPKLLREKMGTALAGGESVNEPLQSITRGLNKAEIEAYPDDLYVLKKQDLEALQKAYNINDKSSDLGLFGKTAGVAKTIALATPRYIAGNASTNFMMNPITGTHLGHYARAIKDLVTRGEEIPEILKRTASYSGYLGDTLPIRAKYKEIYTKLIDDLQNGDFTTKWKAFNSIVNTPLFKSANYIETWQRAAEYLNQAEKYAKETGKTIEAVLKEARANNGLNSTYRAINRRVEEILGDYTGRNYYAPQGLTDLANVALPFYRPFTQAPRQMFNAIKDYPLSTQVFAIAPSRLGKDISDTAQEVYGVEPYQSLGGAPVIAPDGNMPGRVLYNQYHPFSPVGEMVTNPMETFQGNPFLGNIFNIVKGETRFGEAPLPPNAYRMYDGTIAVMDNLGNVSPYYPEEHIDDRVKFSISEALKTLTPVAVLNNYTLPFIAKQLNTSYTTPADTVPLGQIGNFKIPGIMEGGTNRPRVGREIMLPQFGFNYADTYPEHREEFTPTQVKVNRKRIIKKQSKNERR